MNQEERPEKNIIARLIDTLKTLTLEDVLEFEEKYDKQYHALVELYHKMPKKDYFCKLVLLNALISYQLSGTGEQYWGEFSKYFQKRTTGDPIEDMLEFLEKSKYNKRLLGAKKKRLRKTRKLLEIMKNDEEFCEDPKRLLNLLSAILKSPKKSKTLVFAVKMYNYACRIKTGKKLLLPSDIDIPLDNRIIKISGKLGANKKPLELWRKISKAVSIPPLHLDSLLWVSYRMIKDKENPSESKYRRLYDILKELGI